jgi:hypothetical protein
MTTALSPAQQELADRRAEATEAAAAEQARRADGFVSIRDVRAAAKQVGTPEPDWKAERDMVRAAGFGRLRAGALLGDWEILVIAADEASRWYGEPVDLVEVSRRSLAWCLDGRPDGPLRPLLDLSREVSMLDVHIEKPENPAYRQLLDGWTAQLQG